nr:uncharacterized protein LOC123762456 [Procambarus clarkii]
MTRTYANTSRLPRLDTPREHERMREQSPQDLRGANYYRLQDKHRPGPSSSTRVVLLPVLEDEDHPLPYYCSGDVVLPALAEVPWKEDEKRKAKARVETFVNDSNLQTALLDDLVDDTIQEEIVAVASTVIEESKYEKETDRTVAGLVEEGLVMPEVQRLVYLGVWSLLFEIGRSLPQEQYLELKKEEDRLVLDRVAREALLSQMLEGEQWAENLKEEKMLSEVPWDVLVFHYHRQLQENALSNNVALRMLQERLVMQAAREEVFNNCLLDVLEEQLTHTDENEKLSTPPRLG